MFQDISSMLGTDKLVTVSEFAEIAGMLRQTVAKKVKRGELPSAALTPRKIVIPTRLLTADHIADVQNHAAYLRERRVEQVVYFIGGNVGGIKIGSALDPLSRLVTLQCGSPIPLSILATVAGGPGAEMAYHKRFAEHRLHGEWFARCPEILAEIERLAA